MSKRPLQEKTDRKKAVDREMLVVLVISVISFVGNMFVWALDVAVAPKDVACFDFSVLFFLISFLAAGRLRRSG